MPSLDMADRATPTPNQLLALLDRLGACSAARRWVKRRAEEDSYLILLQKIDLESLIWFVQALNIPIQQAYDEAIATAWKAYQETTAPADKAYQEAIATAWKAYQETTAPAWKAYQETTAPAEKAYQETTATAWKACQEALRSQQCLDQLLDWWRAWRKEPSDD